MEKKIIDERNGWEYELKGDYYPTGRVQRDGVMTPNELPEDNGPEKEMQIGIWEQRHLRYIQQYKKSLYLDLFVSGKLNAYLVYVNAQAEDLEIAVKEGVTEKLKDEDRMAWVQRMKNSRERAKEIVNNELIFV